MYPILVRIKLPKIVCNGWTFVLFFTIHSQDIKIVCAKTATSGDADEVFEEDQQEVAANLRAKVISQVEFCFSWR